MIDGMDSEHDFEQHLMQFHSTSRPITMALYLKSCENIKLDAVGVVQQDVYKILRRPEYETRDLSLLNEIPKSSSTNKDVNPSAVTNDNDGT